jgi:hypothetical protein
MASSATLEPIGGRHPDMTLDEGGALFRGLCDLPMQRLDDLALFWFSVLKIDPHCFNTVLTLRLVDAALRLRETSGEAD